MSTKTPFSTAIETERSHITRSSLSVTRDKRRGATWREQITRLHAPLLPLLWGIPMAAWLCVFFVTPLALLFLMSFWTVENFQLTARYTSANWVDFFTTPFFRVGYIRTFT